MNTVYFHRIVKGHICIIPNITQTILTDSTYLSPYSVRSSSMERNGVEYIFELIGPHKIKLQWVRLGERAVQPTDPLLPVQLFSGLLLQYSVNWFE